MELLYGIIMFGNKRVEQRYRLDDIFLKLQLVTCLVQFPSPFVEARKFDA